MIVAFDSSSFDIIFLFKSRGRLFAKEGDIMILYFSFHIVGLFDVVNIG